MSSENEQHNHQKMHRQFASDSDMQLTRTNFWLIIRIRLFRRNRKNEKYARLYATKSHKILTLWTNKSYFYTSTNSFMPPPTTDGGSVVFVARPFVRPLSVCQRLFRITVNLLQIWTFQRDISSVFRGGMSTKLATNILHVNGHLLKRFFLSQRSSSWRRQLTYYGIRFLFRSLCNATVNYKWSVFYTSAQGNRQQQNLLNIINRCKTTREPGKAMQTYFNNNCIGLIL